MAETLDLFSGLGFLDSLINPNSASLQGNDYVKNCHTTGVKGTLLYSCGFPAEVTLLSAPAVIQLAVTTAVATATAAVAAAAMKKKKKKKKNNNNNNNIDNNNNKQEV